MSDQLAELKWRDTRLAEVKPASVLREMKLINSVFEQCRKEWRWFRDIEPDPLPPVVALPLHAFRPIRPQHRCDHGQRRRHIRKRFVQRLRTYQPTPPAQPGIPIPPNSRELAPPQPPNRSRRWNHAKTPTTR